jgi:hypothetical protein
MSCKKFRFGYNNQYEVPFYGAIQNRNLMFPNPSINYGKTYNSIKNIINPRRTSGCNSYGKLWYPSMNIDLNYNKETGGYVNGNGPMGPYFALGLGNYPRSMYERVYFGIKRKKSPSRKRKSPSRKRKSPSRKRKSPSRKRKSPSRKRKSPSRKRKSSSRIVYCLPKEHKFPVNSKKRCSAALSYARYAPDPCKIAYCVKRNCKKYPNVGKTSKLMEKCERKRKKKY